MALLVSMSSVGSDDDEERGSFEIGWIEIGMVALFSKSSVGSGDAEERGSNVFDVLISRKRRAF